MNAEKIMELGTVIANKICLTQVYKREGKYSENLRELPFYSEWKGIEQTLKILGINFEYEYNSDVTEITAVILEGARFDCI